MTNQTRRNCKKCGRIASVATYTEGNIVTEHCFGANCGYNRYVRNEVELSNLNKEDSLGFHKRQFDSSHLLRARSHPTASAYLRKHHIYDMTTEIMYNTKDKRLVFNYKDMYVGRTIDNQTPKWYNYVNSEYPFLVTKQKMSRTKAVILVEDCISACNVSQICDSIALLGTNIQDSYMDLILQYDKVFIALDEDATSKALLLREIIRMVKPCKVIALEKDLKYYNYFELEELETQL